MSLVAKPNFSDISKDMSRALLFSSNRYGADLVPECVQTVEGARYRLQRNGSITVSRDCFWLKICKVINFQCLLSSKFMLCFFLDLFCKI